MVEAECNGEDGGLESDPDVGTWVEDTEAEEETEAWEKQDAWCPGVPTIVIHYESVHCDADGKRICAHWAGKHGAVRDVDKTVLAEK